ncbi:ATP-binding protein [Streptomyces luteolifulvus]|jgi:anti-sigma regulatory factor (Ser/Thr protein kinase)|uniref:ATP-binding protein n=1 Tax=Streptomyces luteolifulvus TaxID=2615112 RepID=A0A6H9US93_9ACTN|nr:ATP-binding protein [Streptomyces luteolifulvus]KAB1141529.1 ATP-binding protein [Streptomyces luteolifulvus]
MITAQLDAAPHGEVEHVFPLPHVPDAVSAVRRRVRAVLTDWRLAAEVADDVLLVVSELLTNAIVHAVPPATLTLSRNQLDRDTAVRVEVTDNGPAAPASAVDPDEHGRGLAIVTALSARCGVRVHPGGTCRWAEVQSG